MNIDKRLNLFLVLWAIGALFSAVSHLVVGDWTAAGTIWSHAPGWQREVAFHDMGWFCLLVYVIRVGPSNVRHATVLLMTGLSILLGLNHMQGLFEGGANYLHVVGTAANVCAVLLGAYVLADYQGKSLIGDERRKRAHTRQRKNDAGE